MFKALATLFCLVFLTSCQPKYADFFPYHDDGSKKPAVAFLPLIDDSNHQFPWNIAKEIHQGIEKRSMQRGHVFFVANENIMQGFPEYGDKDYFSKPMHFFSQFKGIDFLVLSELIEHKIVPYKRGLMQNLYIEKEGNQVLSVKVRIKVVDLKKKTPRTRLFEIVESNHMLPKEWSFDPDREAIWGDEHYLATPLGGAHLRVIKDLTEKIEEITHAIR